MALAIELNEEQSRALDELAGLLKVPKEVLVSAAVRDLLSRPSADFEAAASNLRAKKRGALPSSGVIRYLRLGEVLELHRRLIATSMVHPDYGTLACWKDQSPSSARLFQVLISIPLSSKGCSSWLFPNQKPSLCGW